MAGVGYDSMRDELRENSFFRRRRLWRRSPEPIVRAIKCDRRRLDFRACRKLLLHRLEARLPGSISESMTVRVNHYVHEVRIVERRRGAIVDVVGEMPGRRPRLPEIPAQRAPVLLKSDPPPFGVEVPLIPQPRLAFGRSAGLLTRGDRILDGVAADEHRGAHTIRMKRRGNGRRAPAPVVASDRETLEAKRIGEIDHV